AGAPDFARQFGGMIKIWRRVFGKPDMPFVFAQLPSFGNSCWPKARAAQQQVADSEKNVYMATIIDTGSEKDIHPRDKLPVGKRLAAAALDKVYKIPGARSEGPKFASAEYSDNMAKVSFDTNGKLSFKGKPRGFEVLAGGKWVPATSARIAGNSVELFAADKAAKVSGARYLFMPWAKPFVCLFDDAGMPAYPFTTSK
ncbi:MAG: hypothetical protein IJI37_05165, partial [Opitutales bacterium]|nr:hypothetical protein [Opitutales bacterium]